MLLTDQIQQVKNKILDLDSFFIVSFDEMNAASVEIAALSDGIWLRYLKTWQMFLIPYLGENYNKPPETSVKVLKLARFPAHAKDANATVKTIHGILGVLRLGQGIW